MSDNPYAAPYYAENSELAQDLMPALQGVQFPLRMTFKFFTLAPTVRIFDATGRLILVVRQKLFKFREHVEIFSDEARTMKLAEIRADKIIDWSARYNYTEANGVPIGSSKRRGLRSLWRAQYDVFKPGDDAPDFEIREVNPIAKVVDGLVGSIPLLGLLSLYLFHPSYVAKRIANGTEVMKVTKEPAFLESRFRMEQLGTGTDREMMNLILSFFMLALLERDRG
jgi:hypothetical protein